MTSLRHIIKLLLKNVAPCQDVRLMFTPGRPLAGHEAFVAELKSADPLKSDSVAPAAPCLESPQPEDKSIVSRLLLYRLLHAHWNGV